MVRLSTRSRPVVSQPMTHRRATLPRLTIARGFAKRRDEIDEDEVSNPFDENDPERAAGARVPYQYRKYFLEPDELHTNRDRKLAKRVKALHRKKLLREQFAMASSVRSDGRRARVL